MNDKRHICLRRMKLEMERKLNGDGESKVGTEMEWAGIRGKKDIKYIIIVGSVSVGLAWLSFGSSFEMIVIAIFLKF